MWEALARGRGPAVCIIGLVLLAAHLVGAPPVRAADTVTVDFETGPAIGTPVTTEYEAAAFVRFLAQDPGYRPYRRADNRARSGSTVVDVGSDVCFDEVASAKDCEFDVPSSTGRLTRTASRVTVHAGLFSGGGGQFPVSARLRAYRAGGGAVDGPTVPLDANGFDAAVTVGSQQDDITRFELLISGAGAINARVGYDDLTLEFPDNSLPDISVAAPSDIVRLRQGATTEVPIEVTRLNGSDGPVSLSASGLPPGVTASFEPNPLPGTTGSAVLRLIASSSAGEFLQPREVTVSADPGSDAGVAPGIRTATLKITLVSNYRLRTADGSTDVAVPVCAAADVEVRVVRDRDFTGTVTLQPEVGNRVEARILPSPQVPAEPNLSVARTLRLRWKDPGTVPATVAVRASAPGLADTVLNLRMTLAQPEASLVDTSARTARRFQPGTDVTVRGNGFCPGTRVEVGNRFAQVDAEVAGDGRSLAFAAPRTARPGIVRILPGAAPNGYQQAAYDADGQLSVTTFRSREGFAFDNFGFGWLSFDELTDLVGVDDMFVKVNPCWPVANCSIPTGVPDPVAYLTWGVLNVMLKVSGGHCFGINRTVQELLAGKVKYSKFADGAQWPSELPSQSGPNGALGSWLDSRHAGQGTAEFLAALPRQGFDLSSKLVRLRRELEAGRYPGISMLEGLKGHAVTVYDMEAQPDGSLKIYTYDNNRPYRSGEAAVGSQSALPLERSVITVSADREKWSFPISSDETWSGGGASLFVVPLSIIPDDPTLPSSSVLSGIVLFGSEGGAAAVSRVPDDATYVPVLDSNAVPGAGAMIVGPQGRGALRVGVEGRRAGSYTQLVAGKGSVVGVQEVPTRSGVEDRLTASVTKTKVTFRSGAARPVDLQLAVRKGTLRRAATVSTRASAGKAGTAIFREGRRLVYRHRGKAAKMSFTLSDVGARDADTFASGAIRVGKGAVVTARPVTWSGLERVRVRVEPRSGPARVSVLRNRLRTPSRITRLTPRVSTKGRVRVRYRIRKPARVSSLGVVVRVRRKGRVQRRYVEVVADPGRRGVIRWKKRLRPKGKYRAALRARINVGGPQPTTVTTSRTARLRVR